MAIKLRAPLGISFSALLLWSFALVGLPLLIGLSVTAYLFDQVATQARSFGGRGGAAHAHLTPDRPRHRQPAAGQRPVSGAAGRRAVQRRAAGA